MMLSGGTETSVIAVSNGLGTQRWMTDVSAKMIHSMTGGDESLGHGSQLVEVACEKGLGNRVSR